MYLICDFDGTLVKNDFFEEKFFKLFIEQPWLILCYLAQRNGLVSLKHRLLSDYLPDYDLNFILNQKLIDWIKENREKYQQIWLISASPESFVKRIVEPMAIFDRVHGSISNNLKGNKKLQFIQKMGLSPFSYIGDSSVDSSIFVAASKAYLITSNEIKQLK